MIASDLPCIFKKQSYIYHHYTQDNKNLGQHTRITIKYRDLIHRRNKSSVKNIWQSLHEWSNQFISEC